MLIFFDDGYEKGLMVQVFEVINL